MDEERSGPSLRATFWVVLSLAGVSAALTLLFLGMRSVMGVGGFCAEGGPYDIRQHCPQGIPGVMVGSIWGGLVFAGIYAWQALKNGVPSFLALLWPALFLSLGWNFFEYGIDPPGPQGGVVGGWLVCGVLFAAMGGIPLLVVAKPLLRKFTTGEDDSRPGWAGGLPVGHARRVASRVTGNTNSNVVWELERLDRLHRSGVLDDDEFQAAKRRVLGDGS